MGQDVFVDVGLTWRVTPQVSEGRASRTTVRASVCTPRWEAIGGKLLREIANSDHCLLSNKVNGQPEYKANSPQ